MNSDFSRILTLLRKEKKLSQKQAADDLGISQALLSHYEKGIRECGLEFVCRAAQYYDVSTDYLLGRTPQRYIDLGEAEDDTNVSSRLSASLLLNKRLITNSLTILYDYLIRTGNRKLSVNISNYFMIAVYKIFRRIYSANGKNPQDMFAVAESVYRGYASVSQERIYTDIEVCTSKINEDEYIKALDSIETSPDKIAEEFPDQAGSLFNVIQHAESNIQRMTK